MPVFKWLWEYCFFCMCSHLPDHDVLPSKLSSDNASCHRVLMYLHALFMDMFTKSDHCAHTTALQTTEASLHITVPLAAQFPTYISSSKRSRQPHDLLLVEDPVDTKADQAQSNYTPGRYATFAELCLSDILFSLWVLRKIHFACSCSATINRCFEDQTLAITSRFYKEIPQRTQYMRNSMVTHCFDGRPPGPSMFHLNKLKLAGGKLTARRLKVKLSRVTWLYTTHSVSSPFLSTFHSTHYPVTQHSLKHSAICSV